MKGHRWSEKFWKKTKVIVGLRGLAARGKISKFLTDSGKRAQKVPALGCEGMSWAAKQTRFQGKQLLIPARGKIASRCRCSG